MVDIVRFAEQLNASVLYERRADAALQLRELIFRIPKDREEFANYLGSDAHKLREVEANLNAWADFLGPGTFPLSPVAKKYLFGGTLNAVKELSAIQGRLRRVLDQEGK